MAWTARAGGGWFCLFHAQYAPESGLISAALPTEKGMRLLVGLDMRKLSMGIGSVAEVKCMLSKLSLDKARSLACRVKNLSTAADIEECLRGWASF